MWRAAEKWDGSWSRVGGIGMGVRDGRARSMFQANENDPEESKRPMIQELEGYLIISSGGRWVRWCREEELHFQGFCFLSEVGHEVFRYEPG